MYPYQLIQNVEFILMLIGHLHENIFLNYFHN